MCDSKFQLPEVTVVMFGSFAAVAKLPINCEPRPDAVKLVPAPVIKFLSIS